MPNLQEKRLTPDGLNPRPLSVGFVPMLVYLDFVVLHVFQWNLNLDCESFVQNDDFEGDGEDKKVVAVVN